MQFLIFAVIVGNPLAPSIKEYIGTGEHRDEPDHADIRIGQHSPGEQECNAGQKAERRNSGDTSVVRA